MGIAVMDYSTPVFSAALLIVDQAGVSLEPIILHALSATITIAFIIRNQSKQGFFLLNRHS